MQGLPLASGTVFARDFRIERSLAAGGMGAVYVVEQLSTGRKRALKLMHPSFVHDEDARRRFVLEARIGSRIASEHVVEVQAAGVDDATSAPFLVMELLSGEDLAARLSRGPMNQGEVRDLFRQICHALGMAHASGIVHRDLKPQNIFLSEQKRAAGIGFHAKVLDFGIAKLTTDAGSGTGVIGTPLWMAPEQADPGPVTPAADVWALGLILYTALTGKNFWRTGNRGDATVSQILREMLFDRLPSASERASEQGVSQHVPAWLGPIFDACVVRKVEARFPDAQSFWAALESALDQGSGASRPAPQLVRAEATVRENHPRSGPAFAETAFDFDADAAPLELAFEPRQSRRIPPVSTLPATVALEQPLGAPAITAAPYRRERALLDAPLGEPWWTGFAVRVGVGVLLFMVPTLLVLQHRLSGAGSPVLCRLCTVESKTFANGSIPMREIRHRVEEAFPGIDKRCLSSASSSGRTTITFTIDSDGANTKGRSSTNDETAVCVLDILAHMPYGVGGMLLANGSTAMLGAPTDVTYTLEWNPKMDR